MIATVTADDYTRVFEQERARLYPVVDAFVGVHYLDTDRLERAARILACPVKVSPPNWQHGRVLYSVAFEYLSHQEGPCLLFDCGTAKGFSALCLQWALDDSGVAGTVVSVDVVAPMARVRRNTIAEVDGLQTLAELLSPWSEANDIHFEESTGIDWLKRHPERIHVAFIDGKHTGDVVYEEGALLADRQEAGDIVVFDDCQIPGVATAVRKLSMYDVEYLEVLPTRKYGIGVRR